MNMNMQMKAKRKRKRTLKMDEGDAEDAAGDICEHENLMKMRIKLKMEMRT